MFNPVHTKCLLEVVSYYIKLVTTSLTHNRRSIEPLEHICEKVMYLIWKTNLLPICTLEYIYVPLAAVDPVLVHLFGYISVK